MKKCIFGGQYGSEGKGAVAEWYVRQTRKDSDKMIIVAGENAPNSGHTCSVGKTRSIPASSFFADGVVLGPDSVIAIPLLRADLQAVANFKGKPIDCYIHHNAALMMIGDDELENQNGLVGRISSTGSGSGHARMRKSYMRTNHATIGQMVGNNGIGFMEDDQIGKHVHILNNSQWLYNLHMLEHVNWVMECSQGVLLDNNFGIYPYVTSRSTLPHVALARNGFDFFNDWQMIGVYRTFPIRTGGPSGPTGGKEITFDVIGKPPEITTVTKRTRRIFEFSTDDFALSLGLSRPELLVFTHLDYIGINNKDAAHALFPIWCNDHNIPQSIAKMISWAPGELHNGYYE